MTITEVNVTTGTGSVSGFGLREGLTAALVAVSTDVTFDALNYVQLTWQPGTLTIEATDRYRLIEATVTGDGVTGEGSMLVHRKDAAEIVRAIPKPGKRGLGLPMVAISMLGDVATFSGDGWSRECRLGGGSFPKTAGLWPTTTEPVEEMGFNPDFLAMYAKAGARGMVRMTFNGPGKPAVVGWEGEHCMVRTLLMPIRITG